MDDFQIFTEAVAEKYSEMERLALAHPDIYTLVRVKIDKDLLWKCYLDSFREPQQYNCTACRHFIQNIGNVVLYKHGEKYTTIWDVCHKSGVADTIFGIVAENMHNFVNRHYTINNLALCSKDRVGINCNYKRNEDGSITTFNHFYIDVNKKFVVEGNQALSRELAYYQALADIYQRAFKEIRPDAVRTVLELISQNLLYRGIEFKNMLLTYLTHFDYSHDAWIHVGNTPESVLRIKNSVIGALLLDLSGGEELEIAVRKYEKMVAPENYKRPTALITQSMIDSAKSKCEELGLTAMLTRRHARMDDISVNNMLFVDRSTQIKAQNNGFDGLAPTKPKKYIAGGTQPTEIKIDRFVRDVLPHTTELEILFESKHIPNLVSLIAPETREDAPQRHLFKWSNNFTWTYNGDATDSIKQRVKAAGGNVTGDFRASLSWHNYNDLDLHLIEPNKFRIYYGAKKSPYGGQLDVDMNAHDPFVNDAVENIFYQNVKSMKKGIYTLVVNNFSKRSRSADDTGFEVELELCGKIHNFKYEKPVKHGEFVPVCKIELDKAGGFQILESFIPSGESVRKVWNIHTQTMQRVNLMCLSPNYWPGSAVGNKHFLFMMAGCRNPKETRGFFNEFLIEELNEHRKVFEILGGKMTVPYNKNQLSGLGFSSTKRESVIVKSHGNVTRLLKILF